jgi:hypothetical protein
MLGQDTRIKGSNCSPQAAFQGNLPGPQTLIIKALRPKPEGQEFLKIVTEPIIGPFN